MELVGEDLAPLADFLWRHLPRGLVVFNFAKMVECGWLPPQSRPKCFVDVWPKPNFICVWADEPLTTARKTYRVSSIFTAKSSFDADKLAAFLHNTAVKNCFLDLPNLVHVISNGNLTEEVAKVVGKFGKAEFGSRRFQVWWDPPFLNKSSDSQQQPVPEGHFLDSLQPSDTGFVLEKLTHPIGREEALWRDRILHLPSGCIKRKEDGAIVCFGLTHTMGYGTHGFTVSEERGKGLMGLVGAKQHREKLAKGLCSFGTVTNDNFSSQNVTTKFGMADTGVLLDYIWFKPTCAKI